MNPIKTLLFTFFLFALFAANAAAQCGGKTVHILLPDDWNKTTITFHWEGQYQDIALTKNGNWYSFTFPSGLSNDNMSQNNGKGKAFWFSKATKNGNPNSGQNNWIAKGQWWNKSGNAPADANGFTCSEFGSGKDLYISPNPNQPTSTISDANPPNAKVFYFYPPDDPKWIAGKSYITDDPDDKNKAKLMGVDQNKCGWYRVVYFNEEPPDYVQIWLGANGVDKIGSNGRQDDLDEGSGVTISQIGAIRLKDKFGEIGDTLFFVADDGYEDGWSRTDPGTGDGNRCRYELAAFIYDTDASVHKDFSCGIFKKEDQCESPTASWGQNVKTSCTGVIKGLAKPILDHATKKIECGDCTKKNCWTDADWFSKAFTATKGVNVQHCYDMPFTQAKNGRYEFDSDIMTQDGTPNGKLLGGFFPKILNDAKSSDAAYKDCPNCATKRQAESFVPINTKTWDRDTYMSYQSKPDDFKDGDSAPKDAWDWGERDKISWYLWDSSVKKGSESGMANEQFCFESHAQFVYDPEQEFYFTGDDDIWVYVNDTLVVDLGGAHLAAPGHIKLKDIKGKYAMTPGETYDIDIFFCDRRTTQSNVRISTNMYIKQQSAFQVRKESKDQWMCADITGGADCASKMGVGSAESTLCGPDLINSPDFKVEFYMVKKNTTDTLFLSGSKNPSCSGNSTEFTCYGAIKVDKGIYSCAGKKECKGDPDAIARITVTGNYTVYARLMKNGQQVGKAPSIDNFKSETNTRIIWGKVASFSGKTSTTLKDAYGGDTKKEQRIIAGKRTPIYISSGSWRGSDTFEFDDEDIVPGAVTYTLKGAGSGLRVFKDKDSNTPVSGGSIPAGGIDTLWVEADYTVKNNTEYILNVVAETSDAPSMKLTVYLPTLRFVEKDFKTAVNPSGWQRWVPNGAKEPPFVSQPLEMYVEAYDPERKETCGHCNFALTETSSHNNPKISSKDIVKADGGLKIENGIATIYIRGYEDTGDAQYTATWEISVPRTEISASWDKLRFKEAPIPLPAKAYMYDRNGDGIADSLRIEYNKSFKGKGDSLLPALIAVVWAKGDPVYFHSDSYKVADLQDEDKMKGLYKDKSFFTNNRSYWDSFIEQDSIIVLSGNDLKFSKDIQTAPVDIGGRQSVIESWTPYINADGCVGSCSVDRDLKNSKNPSNLIDRVSPIVVRAEYLYASTNKGNCEETTGCKESLTAYLSEPVFAGIDANDEYLIKNPFSYCFGRSQKESSCPYNELDDNSQRFNQGWDNNIDWKWELAKGDDEATDAFYKPNTRTTNKMAQPGSKGDSIVELSYWAKKTAFGTTRMPKADDWIKIRWPEAGNIFSDAEGNAANPRERGVLIKGTNPSKKIPIKIAGVKPGDKPLGGTFANGGEELHWWSDEAKKWGRDSLYIPGNIAELLPVPKEQSDPDSIKYYYPASVGTVFDIADKIHNDINNFFDAGGECDLTKESCKTRGGEPLTKDNIAKAITVRASAYYHTNIGNYTAHRDNINIPCTNAIFQNRNGTGNCYTSESNFYLAWDLRANSGRYVGAGAYVGISKFHLQLDYKDSRGSDRTKKLSEEEFIEMFGVTRPKVVK